MKKLGFGCMRLPVINGDHSNIDIDKFKKMIDIFIDRGFTYFDTAIPYHDFNSEMALKEALVKRYPRDSYTITTKLYLHGLFKLEQAKKMFNESLEKIGVDYVDYYFLHAVRLYLYEQINDLGVIEYLKELKNEGKIKHLGFSYHDTAENLDKILNECDDWAEYVQLQINYFDWDSESVEARKCYEVCNKHHKKVFVMEPVKGGKLVNLPEKADKIFKEYNRNASNASWAIRYAASLKNVEVVLSGMSSVEQVLDNTSFMSDFKPINDEERDLIGKVLKIIQSEKIIECTACRYCCDGCPKNIDIPEIFKVFNNIHRQLNDYKDVVINKGKASDCIECGQCESVCPQGLKIRDYLKDCSKALEE